MNTRADHGEPATRRSVRQRAIDIGVAILAADGADALTLKRIADALGVRPPALHWHFRDRREVLDELFEAAMAPLPALWASIEGAGVAEFEHYCIELADGLRPAVTLAAAMGAGPVGGWPHGRALIDAAASAAVDAGVTDPASAAHRAPLLLLALIGSVVPTIGQRGRADRQANAEAVRDLTTLMMSATRRDAA